jgi:hypothetical protein
VGDRFQARLPDTGGWFDLWHTHVDWRGEGNADPDVRRECLRALFAAWERVEVLAEKSGTPWQSWVVVHAEDSGQDAVYLHTPNPNRDNFPYPFSGVVWGTAPPEWLEEFVAGDQCEVGRSDFEGAILYWVRRPASNRRTMRCT